MPLTPESRILNPAVILIRPQMGENIGAVARAMSNFGLEELRIVAPRDGWPNAKAGEMAAGAEYIINSAKIYANFTEAMADINIAYATTARPRDMNKRVVTPEIALKEIATLYAPPFPTPPQKEREFLRAALVFGPERAGMENWEITLCDNIITIPTGEKNRSLNLAQSAVVIGYEWQKASAGYGVLSVEDKEIMPASKSSMFGLFDQLEAYLDKAEYFRVAQKKPVMWQNLKNMLLRGGWSEQEIRTFRGMLRSLWERNGNG